jgi:hypothetical protein
MADNRTRSGRRKDRESGSQEEVSETISQEQTIVQTETTNQTSDIPNN